MRTTAQGLKALGQEIMKVRRSLQVGTVNQWHTAYLDAMTDVDRSFRVAEGEDQTKRLERIGYVTGFWHGLCMMFGVDPKVIQSTIKGSPPPILTTQPDRSPTVKRPKNRKKGLKSR